MGRRLHSVVAELGRLAGWAAFDSGHLALSQRYYLAALRNAHVAGDRAIGANILGFMSMAAAHYGASRDGLSLALSALSVKDELTPAVAGALHLRLVEAAAVVGERDTARRAGDQAVELLARSKANPDEEPPWIYWFTEAELAGGCGDAELALGNYREAERLLRRSVGLLNPVFTRDRVVYLCALAKARLGASSLEHACATASEAATAVQDAGSIRNRRMLASVRHALTPYDQTAAVREFDARHGELLTQPYFSHI